MADENKEQKTGIDLGMDLITNGNAQQLQTVPYIVYEMNETRHERREKRMLYWLVLPLISALLICNMAWLYVFQSYDYTSTETVTVDGQDGTALYQDGEGNVLTNGENNKKIDEEEK